MNKKAIFTLLILCFVLLFALAVGASSDVSEAGEEGTSVGTYIIISFVIGLLAAIIATAVMRGQLKSVRAQKNARSYIKEGSYKLNGRRDLFLYSTVTKTPRPKNNDSKNRGN